MNNPKRLSEFLSAYIDVLIPKQKQTIFDLWNQVAGSELRGHSEVVSISDEKLLIHVDSSGYLSYAELRRAQYETKLRKLLAEKKIDISITKIRFVIAPRA